MNNVWSLSWAEGGLLFVWCDRSVCRQKVHEVDDPDVPEPSEKVDGSRALQPLRRIVTRGPP